jgi:hypothetical protein
MSNIEYIEKYNIINKSNSSINSSINNSVNNVVKKKINYSLYTTLLIISIFIFFIVCHIKQMSKVSNEIEILQTEDVSKIEELLIKKQPTIFRGVLYDWLPIAEIFDLDVEEINEIIENIQGFSWDIKQELSIYGLPLSIGWKYKIFDKNEDDKYFRKQNNHRHLIGQIVGTQRIFIASPNQSNYMMISKMQDYDEFNNSIRSSINFWDDNEKIKEPFCKMEYIEIILREGNLIYIPKGWWYLQKIEENGLIIEAVNTSILNYIC